MFEYFEKGNQLYLILEYPQPSITMRAFINNHPFGIEEMLARSLMRQAATAAKFCIDHNVNHNDLATRNILINTEMMQIKLIDFGMAKLISTSSGELNFCVAIELSPDVMTILLK